MFLHLSVILSTRGLCPGGFCLGGLCPGVLDPGRVSVQGFSVQEDPPAATVQLRAGNTHPTEMHSCSVLLLPPANEVWGKVMFLHLSVSHSVHSGHRNGRYASYWNAYLLFWVFNQLLFGVKYCP